MLDVNCPECGSSEYERDVDRGYRMYCSNCGFSYPNVVGDDE